MKLMKLTKLTKCEQFRIWEFEASKWIDKIERKLFLVDIRQRDPISEIYYVLLPKRAW